MGRTSALALLVGASLLAASCGPPSPSLPDAELAPGQTAGVVWFDDGDGVIDDGEDPGSGLSIGVGVDGQLLSTVSGIVTDDRGGFVVDRPVVGAVELATYVQVSWPVEGPDGSDVEVQLRQPADQVPLEIPLPQLARCEATLDEASDGRCGELRLPDLVPLVEDFGQSPTQPVAAASARIDTTTLPGVTLLRFASATANLGDGPLHMIPESKPDDDRLPTWQRIWTDDGRFVDHRSGEFVFHEGHDHFHVDGFEQYRLLTPAGDEIAVGEKISFCLIDSVPARPDAQALGVGVFLDAVCESAGEQQALNPGWADYYGAGLDDQWIDVTGVAPGDYLVEIIADPDDLLLESDETNNRATFAITITEEQLAG